MKLHRAFGLAALVTTLALPMGLNLSSAFAASETTKEVSGTRPVTVTKPENPSAMTADQILQKAAAALFPPDFTAKLEITQVKPGQPNSVSKMMLYKRGKDTVRADYLEPAAQAGQKMLRKEGQIWMYMSDIKRPIKMSPKQSLGGSDFANGDIMRLNLEDDYTPKIAQQTDTEWILELKAKSKDVTYDVIKYTVQKKDIKSVKMEYYTLSGKLLKTLEFQDYKNYSGLLRPSLFVMKSNLAKDVYTNMRYLQFDPGKTLPESQFKPDALAKQ